VVEGEKVRVACMLEIETVTMIITPLGTGQLVFHLNWLPDKKRFPPMFSNLTHLSPDFS